jgi:hypothetical protein
VKKWSVVSGQWPVLAADAVLFAAGVWVAFERRGLFEYSWSHPMVMLVGQFLLLAAASLAPRRWRAAALAPFWVFSGVTAGPLLARASELLGGRWAAAGAAIVGVGIAVALYLKVRREPEGVGETCHIKSR